MTHQTHLLFHLTNVIGKGEGIIAKKDIGYGSLILKEEPVIKGFFINDNNVYHILKEKLQKLTDVQQKMYMKLHDAYSKNGEKTVEGIYDTNRISLCQCESGLFIMASKFNHSCDPNVGIAYASPYLRVYAKRNISEGEELCISYGGKFKEFSERQKYLYTNWKFTCVCKMCKMNIQQRKKFEETKKKYKELEVKLSKSCDFLRMKTLLMKMLYALITCRLMDPASKYEHEYEMFLIHENLLMPKVARQHATQAWDAARMIWGEEYWILGLYKQYLDGDINVEVFKKMYQDTNEKCCCAALRLKNST